ncbi:15312_t:CDS:2, partial [Gigaspora rosea]
MNVHYIYFINKLKGSFRATSGVKFFLQSYKQSYSTVFITLLIHIINALTTITNKYFNHTESELGDHNAPPLIADIKTYDDGTILVHIIRNESTQSVDCSKIGGMSLEQKLRIRLIFLNGT